MDKKEQTEMWALVELFGHSRIAGKVTQAELGSGELIRVDVPAVKDSAPITKYYNVKAIYGITPMDEESATRLAMSIHTAPISEWSLSAELERINQKRLGTAHDDGEEPDIE